MSATPSIPLPGDDEPMIVWAMKHGRAAVELLNNLALMETKLVPPSTSRGRAAVIVSGEGILLHQPYQFPKRVSAPSGGAVIDTQARDAIAALLTQLNAIGFNPSIG